MLNYIIQVMPFFLLLALPWNWLAVTLICTFEANGCLPLLKLPPFNGIHSAWLKDHVDLQTIVRKEQGTEDVEIFFG